MSFASFSYQNANSHTRISLHKKIERKKGKEERERKKNERRNREYFSSRTTENK